MATSSIIENIRVNNPQVLSNILKQLNAGVKNLSQARVIHTLLTIPKESELLQKKHLRRKE